MNKKVKYLGDSRGNIKCMSCGNDIRFFSAICGGKRYAKRKEIKCPKCKFINPLGLIKDLNK